MKRGIALAVLSCALLCAWWILEERDPAASHRGTAPERTLAADRIGSGGGPDPELVAAKRREVMRRIGQAVWWLDVIVVDSRGEPRSGVPVWLSKRDRDEPIDRGLTDEEWTREVECDGKSDRTVEIDCASR